MKAGRLLSFHRARGYFCSQSTLIGRYMVTEAYRCKTGRTEGHCPMDNGALQPALEPATCESQVCCPANIETESPQTRVKLKSIFGI